MSEIIKFNLNGVWISAPDDWLDATDNLPKKDRHSKQRIVLQKDDGIGSINVSVLRWKYPIQLENLRGMLLDMCGSFIDRDRKPFDYMERTMPLKVAAASVADDDGVFTRFWYCSDGEMMALIAYTSDEEPHLAELNECEKLVDDLVFGGGKSAAIRKPGAKS